MIRGVHAVLYTTDATAARDFLRDKVGLAFHLEGEGWLVFDTPEGAVGCHQSDSKYHEVTFYCDDINQTIAELQSRGVSCSPIVEESWGRVTTFDVPGGGPVRLYEPTYERS